MKCEALSINLQGWVGVRVAFSNHKMGKEGTIGGVWVGQRSMSSATDFYMKSSLTFLKKGAVFWTCWTMTNVRNYSRNMPNYELKAKFWKITNFLNKELKQGKIILNLCFAFSFSFCFVLKKIQKICTKSFSAQNKINTTLNIWPPLISYRDVNFKNHYIFLLSYDLSYILSPSVTQTGVALETKLIGHKLLVLYLYCGLSV